MYRVFPSIHNSENLTVLAVFSFCRPSKTGGASPSPTAENVIPLVGGGALDAPKIIKFCEIEIDCQTGGVALPVLYVWKNAGDAILPYRIEQHFCKKYLQKPKKVVQ